MVSQTTCVFLPVLTSPSAGSGHVAETQVPGSRSVTQLVSSTPPEQIDGVVVLWRAFPYICPEAVLATGSFLCINCSNDEENTNADGQKGAGFAPVTALPSAGFVQETASGELQASCRASRKSSGRHKTAIFKFFPYVCPEPVLVNCSVLA
jgi:hypothetical protein